MSKTFRLLEAYISTNSSEDLQLKAKKGIAQRVFDNDFPERLICHKL